MFDVKRNRIQAVNYNIFLELLNYSLPKLHERQGLWDRFIFTDSLIQEKAELAEALGRSVEDVESVSRKVIDIFKWIREFKKIN